MAKTPEISESPYENLFIPPPKNICQSLRPRAYKSVRWDCRDWHIAFWSNGGADLFAPSVSAAFSLRRGDDWTTWIRSWAPNLKKHPDYEPNH
jgi:hypothetical protein